MGQSQVRLGLGQINPFLFRFKKFDVRLGQQILTGFAMSL